MGSNEDEKIDLNKLTVKDLVLKLNYNMHHILEEQGEVKTAIKQLQEDKIARDAREAEKERQREEELGRVDRKANWMGVIIAGGMIVWEVIKMSFKKTGL